jgi:DNA polymerase zeta
MFSMSIFVINYYMTKPEAGLDQTYSDFRCSEIKQVPVIRVFGSTPEGKSI